MNTKRDQTQIRQPLPHAQPTVAQALKAHLSPLCIPVRTFCYSAYIPTIKPKPAFTLIELVVVIAVFAVLGGLLVPALAATHDRNNRMVCQNNLRQIAVESTQYAGDNNDYFFPAGNNTYPLQFDGLQSKAYSEVGLTNVNGIWTCPNRPGFPFWSGAQWIIGYQYYGGITNWINNIYPVSPGMPSYSPVKLSHSNPHWMLAADLVAQPNGPGTPWGTSTNIYGAGGWASLPAHHTADSMNPQGGNEVFCDGSVQWIDLEKMYYLHSWGYPRALYFYQDLSDATNLLSHASRLIRAQPYH